MRENIGQGVSTKGYHYKYIDIQTHLATKNLKDNVAKLFQQTIKLSLYI